MLKAGIAGVARIFDSGLARGGAGDDRIDLGRVIPFALVHLFCLGVFVVGVSSTAIVVALALYVVRMFAITGFYHRYFSHRTFRTTRAMQFVMGFVGCLAAQRGPLWWAAHHRSHHKLSDTETDVHSPRRRGFLWSHMGWFLTRDTRVTRRDLVPDLYRVPELRLLDRFDIVPSILLGAGLWFFGETMGASDPSVSGWQLVVWGSVVSTVVLYHATYTINSLAHTFGTRRYATGDESRNSFWLSLLTFGEGWHNNHHHYPRSVRQGFFWWEVDLTWYALKLLSLLGLVWDLHPVPARVRAAHRLRRRA